MPRIISVDTSNGQLTVTDYLGKNPDGSPAIQQWNIAGKNRQIEKHSQMFGADIAQQMNRGDREMIADIIAENIADAKP